MAKTGAKRKSEEKQGTAAVVLPDPVAPEVTGSPEALERFRGEALGLPADLVVPYRTDATRAYHNAVAAREVVLAARAAVDATGVQVKWSDVESLGDVGVALIQAAALVDGDGCTRGVLKALLTEAAPLRRSLLLSARALASQSLLPSDTVRAVHKGRGPQDAGRDLVVLAALFTEHAEKIRGKHPISAKELRRAAELGAEIATHARSAATPKDRKRVGEAKAAAELRDRVYTLLLRRFDTLGRAAGALWGLDAVNRVPPLHGAIKAKRPRVQAPQPTP